jgi:hypothetical protein
MHNASSPLARPLAAELPDVDVVLESYRSVLPARPATIQPRAARLCLGAVGNYRDRGRPAAGWALTDAPSQDRAVAGRPHAVSIRRLTATQAGTHPASVARIRAVRASAG